MATSKPRKSKAEPQVEEILEEVKQVPQAPKKVEFEERAIKKTDLPNGAIKLDF